MVKEEAGAEGTFGESKALRASLFEVEEARVAAEAEVK